MGTRSTAVPDDDDVIKFFHIVHLTMLTRFPLCLCMDPFLDFGPRGRHSQRFAMLAGFEQIKRWHHANIKLFLAPAARPR